MRTLIYVKVAEQVQAQEILPTLRGPKDTASIRVVEFWQGETERCDVVVTDHEGVAKAYGAVGVQVKPFAKVKKVEKPVEVQEVVEPVVKYVVEVAEDVQEEPAKRVGRPKRGE